MYVKEHAIPGNLGMLLSPAKTSTQPQTMPDNARRALSLFTSGAPRAPPPRPAIAHANAGLSAVSRKCGPVQGGGPRICPSRVPPRATHRAPGASHVIQSVKRIAVLLRLLQLHRRARAAPLPRHSHLTLIDFGEEQAQYSLFILCLYTHIHGQARVRGRERVCECVSGMHARTVVNIRRQTLSDACLAVGCVRDANQRAMPCCCTLPFPSSLSVSIAVSVPRQ
jgi:hypothetical protein